MDLLSVIFSLLLLTVTVQALSLQRLHPSNQIPLQSSRISFYRTTSNNRNINSKLYNTGGWGIGPQRELTPEEFATGGTQNKKYFEGYQIRNRGEFMRQIAQDKEQMIRGEIDELLGVASIAGLKVKNPNERLNKFDSSIIEDDEELDVSVQWDDNENNNNRVDISTTDLSTKVDDTDSITRLDDDTGALGVW